MGSPSLALSKIWPTSVDEQKSKRAETRFEVAKALSRRMSSTHAHALTQVDSFGKS